MVHTAVARFSDLATNEGVVSAAGATTTHIFERMTDSWHQIKQKRQFSAATPQPYRLINIDPCEVSHLVVPRYLKPLKRRTYVVGGDWDQRYTDSVLHINESIEDEVGNQVELIGLENFTFWNSIRHHFEEDLSWEDTNVFEKLCKISEQNSERWGSTLEEILVRLQGLDDMYKSMNSPGYLTQREIQNQENIPLNSVTVYPPEKHEVLVNSGRDDQIIFVTGRNRFCIARVLGLSSIPVRVHVRHKQWQKTREEVVKSPNPIQDFNSSINTHPDIKPLIK